MAALDAGVIKQYVDSADASFNIGNSVFHRLWVGDVKDRSMGGGTLVAEFHRRLLGAFCGDIVDDDFRAVLGQSLSHHVADTLSGTGN